MACFLLKTVVTYSTNSSINVLFRYTLEIQENCNNYEYIITELLNIHLCESLQVILLLLYEYL